jgi:hypothetical protein
LETYQNLEDLGRILMLVVFGEKLGEFWEILGGILGNLEKLENLWRIWRK